jgi:cobalt-zinc-cadmium efflux system outer membrane protein
VGARRRGQVSRDLAGLEGGTQLAVVRRVIVRPTVLAALALAATPVARASDLPPEPTIPERLTLGQALTIFRTHGLDLLIAEAAAQSAEGDALAAGAIPNPSATGGLYHSFFSDGLYQTHNGWFVGLGDSNAIEDTLSGKRGLRKGAAEAALAAARLQRADAQRTIEMQVKQQYFQAVAAAAALEFANEIAASTGHTFELNQVRYKSGAISEVDLSRTETAKLEAEQAVDSAGQALRQAKVQLAFLLGQRHAFTDFAIDPGQLRFAVPAGLAGMSADQLVDRAIASRPDLQAQESQRTRSARALALAKRQRFPDLGIGVQYAQQGSSSASNAISPPTLELSLTGTLPLLYQQQGEIKKAQADGITQDAQAAKLHAQVVADVESAFAAYQTSRGLVARMEGRLLDRAARARQLVELQYQKGAASLLEFLDAQRTYVATKVEYIQDLTAYWNAVFQIEAATATELIQ